MLTLDDIAVKGKNVFVRSDLNSSIDEKTGEIASFERIEVYAETIKELSEKGARVVVISHQGRPGDYDFISLEKHAKALEETIGKHVEFIDDIYCRYARHKIKNMHNGHIILLDNIRMLSEESLERPPEEHARSIFIQKLYPLCHYYVLDAFSAAHRPHASIVGFATLVPTVAGRAMEREIKSLKAAVDNPRKPVVLVVGGAKVKDSLKIIEHWIKNNLTDKILTCGLVGNVMLAASGKKLGKSDEYLRNSGFGPLIEEGKGLLDKHGDRILLPEDVAFNDGGRREIGVDELPVNAEIWDIGMATCEKYGEVIGGAGTIVINGPAGVYESAGFEKGTKEILGAIANSGAYSLVGGGNTVDAIDKLGLAKEKFTYISVAGKAFIEFVSGKELPGIKALEISEEKFRGSLERRTHQHQ
ncbi:MAG: phosphoglycerate kinase [Candidatus Micrarchaeia archaeon]